MPKRAERLSNGRGQSMRSPKTTRRMTAIMRRLSGPIPNSSGTTLKATATAANEITKPSAIKAGLALLVCPIEAPRRIGRRGREHGAAIVKIPASSANRTVSIGLHQLNWTHESTSVNSDEIAGRLHHPRHVFVKLLQAQKELSYSWVTRRKPSSGVQSTTRACNLDADHREVTVGRPDLPDRRLYTEAIYVKLANGASTCLKI